MKKIVVNGLTESAGKTTAALDLYFHLQKHGEVELSKPLAANNYWHDYPVIREGIGEGRLFGEDAKLLSEASGVREEIVNPLHRLWIPSSAVHMGPERGEDLVLLDRISHEEKTFLLVNSQIDTPQDLSPLLDAAEETRKYSGEGELNKYLEELYPPALRGSFSRVKGSDLLVIESYSEIALPPGIRDVDVVVTVEPGRGYVSDGRRFEKAHSLVRGVYMEHGVREVSTEKVLEMVDSERYDIPPVVVERGEPTGVYSEMADSVLENL